MNHRIRKELEDEKKNSLKILHDMETLQNQLAEYQNGLWAAARISDELEQSDLTNSSLREECKNEHHIILSMHFLPLTPATY